MHNFACTVKRMGRGGVGAKCYLKSSMSEKLASEFIVSLIFSKSLAVPPDPENHLWARIHLFSTDLDKGSVDNTWKNKPVLLPWPSKRRPVESVMRHLVSQGSHLFSLLHTSVSDDGKRRVHGTEFNSLYTPQRVLRGRCWIYSSQLTFFEFCLFVFLNRD